MHDAPCAVAVEPPLEQREIAFLDAFTTAAALRRVWPGQPSAHSPWRPAPDGRRLVLDQQQATAEPEHVAQWLTFLVDELLAPSTAAALDAALTAGLRGGHEVTGRVVVDGVREVSVDLHRVTERLLPPDAVDAVVLDLGARRAQSTER